MQQVKGLGPFAAELVVVRGANPPDALPRHERRLDAEIAERYGPGRTLAEVSEARRPYRTWAAVHLRALREQRTGEIAGRSVTRLRCGGRLVLVALSASGTLQIPVVDTVLNGSSGIGSIVGTRADLAEVFGLQPWARPTPRQPQTRHRAERAGHKPGSVSGHHASRAPGAGRSGRHATGGLSAARGRPGDGGQARWSGQQFLNRALHAGQRLTIEPGAIGDPRYAQLTEPGQVRASGPSVAIDRPGHFGDQGSDVPARG